MAYIDLNKIKLIGTGQLYHSCRVAYYTNNRIHANDLLYTVEPEKTSIWKVVAACNCKLPYKLRPVGLDSGANVKYYRAVVTLQEITPGPIRDKILEELIYPAKEVS
jgi:hypothetical protein